MWDLHRNRGSVQATTERVLMGRGLEPVCDEPPLTRSGGLRCANVGMITGATFFSAAASVHGFAGRPVDHDAYREHLKNITTGFDHAV
jgi:hypothetical protein